jgi:hypothetical protein
VKCSDIKKISTPNAIIQTLTNLICKHIMLRYMKKSRGGRGPLLHAKALWNLHPNDRGIVFSWVLLFSMDEYGCRMFRTGHNLHTFLHNALALAAA